MGLSGDRSEIAFFDVETTVALGNGRRFAILEFGAILVCPKKLLELDSFSALVRPSDLGLISSLSARSNGITREAIISAHTFAEISDRVYDILHGRIWAGHNILRFDCARIREAFEEISRPAPEPKGIIDSLALLTQRFGRRAGDMKMATLATYFGIGQQTHRSLDDVRMNLEVLKHCATVLFLESSLPEVFAVHPWVSSNAATSSHGTENPSLGATNVNRTYQSNILNLDSDQISSPNPTGAENHPILSLVDEIKAESLQTDTGMAATATISPDCIDSVFLDPDLVSLSSIFASHVEQIHTYRTIELLHRDARLQLFGSRLKVRFGMSTKFVDNAGQPRLSIVVNASPSLCRVLDACDVVAERLFSDSTSTSTWRPVVTRRNGFFDYPTVRLNIPIVVCAGVALYATEIYQKGSSGAAQRLVFSKFDAAELDTLLIPGSFNDASFSLDTFDYRQTAGIRLVAKKLAIHPR